MAEEEKDDWLDDLDDDESGDLDIDSLLPDAEEAPAAAEADGGEGGDSVDELDQSDIDALFAEDGEGGEGGTDEAEAAPAPPAGDEAGNQAEAAAEEGGEAAAADSGDGEGGDEDELTTSDIDSLLAEAGGDTGGDDDPSQEEIDQLFSEVDDEPSAGEADPFQAEEVDFKDVVGGDDDDDDSFTLDGTNNAFDAEEFGLDDDLADLPDFDDGSGGGEAPAAAAGDEEATVLEDEADLDTVLLDDEETAAGQGKKGLALPFALPAPLQSPRNLGIAGGALVILLVAGYFLFGRGSAPAPEQAKQGKEPPAASQQVAAKEEKPQPAKPERPNSAPTAADAEVDFQPGNTEIAVHLKAMDLENDPLNYEILSLPDRGRLSGEPPDLIYLPNKDFSGEDSFVFRVSDGRALSEPATVHIVAAGQAPPEKTEEATAAVPAAEPPPAAPKAPKKPRTLRARTLRIAAANAGYTVRSTDELYIDWEELWSKVNDLPYSGKTRVEIMNKNLHGRLVALDNAESVYRPDKYFGGREVINYRFRLGRLKSKVRRLTIKVKLGRPAPEIHLAKLKPAYAPGETVVLDAAASRDEKRDRLTFSWKQVSGVPVMVEPMNKEKSRVAFVVPSTFNTVADPGPVFRLTVVDSDGKTDERVIKVKTASRRRTAVWRGLVGGGIADDPVCPYGDCPGALLPWPYPE